MSRGRAPLRTPATPGWAAAVAAVVALAAVATTGLTLTRTLDARPLLVGIAIGAGGALVVTAALGLRGLPWPARATLIVAAVWAVPAVAAADPGGPLAMPGQLSTLLTLTWPAAGLPALATVPACMSFAAGAIGGWRTLRGDPAGAAASTVGGVVAGAVIAGPAGVPWWVVAAAMAVIGATLAAGAGRRYDDLPVLAAPGGSAAVRASLAPRNRWQLGAAALVPAVALGAAAIAAPTAGPVDLRRWVDTPTITVTDDNPLAIVARAIDDPPVAAVAVDVDVTVVGPAPGRLRLAVLDGYGPEGWRQAAAFGRTGRRLPAADVAPTDLGARTAVHVHQQPGATGLRATPTAGTPLTVDEPGNLRYASSGEVLLGTGASDVTFAALPAEDAPSVVAQANVANLDPALAACPDSALIDGIAAGIVGDTLDPVQRLRAIESYLKFRRVYDPGAPGGQTLASIERFLAQDFARGNLESFVTSFALLARCADVPVRVVVGYPAPAADATTSYSGTDLTAWVETPLAASGWVPFDPVPTPEEQERQARAVQQPPPSAGAQPDIVEPAKRAVTPRTPSGEGTPWRWLAAILLALFAAVALWTFGMPALIEARRRRIAEPALTTMAAWASVTDRLLDRRVPLRAHMTPTECTRAAEPLPEPVATALRALATLSDRARYDGEHLTRAEAADAWDRQRALVAALPRTWRARLLPLRAPRRMWRRLGSTRGPTRHP